MAELAHFHWLSSPDRRRASQHGSRLLAHQHRQMARQLVCIAFGHHLHLATGCGRLGEYAKPIVYIRRGADRSV
jgi:hypothetical protein